MSQLIAIAITLGAFAFVMVLLFGRKQRPWNEMTEGEQKKKKIMVASGTAVFLAGLLATFLLRKKK